MYSQILSRTRTKEEVDSLKREIEVLEEAFYKDGGRGFDAVLNSHVRHWVSEAMKADWTESNIDSKAYLEKLKNKIEKLGIVQLTLAFEPTNITIDKFINYIRQNVGEDIILEVSYDPNIVAGTMISYKGNFRDFSLKRLFEEELKAGKEEIEKILK